MPFDEETYSVSQLCEEVRDFLAQGFYSVWVVGEVQRLRPSQRGHSYFELVEKDGREGIQGKLDAVLWRGDRLRLGRSAEPLAEGVEIRCRGNLDFYPPAGRLQFVLRQIDPTYTLGRLEQQRRETLAALTAAGLLDTNGSLPMPELPLSLALITSADSAAYHDFLSSLEESGYGFRVTLIHSSVQGAAAEAELVSALGAAGEVGADAIVMVRGGGSRSDLAVFDQRAVAEAIARAPVPVVTGLGHEIDVAIADVVAHTAVTTPTKAAEVVIERVAQADLRLEDLNREIPRTALRQLQTQREKLAGAARMVPVARLRLASAAVRLAGRGRSLARLGGSALRARSSALEERNRRLAREAPRALARRSARLEEVLRAIADRSEDRLREGRLALAGWERLCRQLSPRRTLERGFSLTRDGAGRVVRDASKVAAGDRLITQLSQGEVKSRVSKTHRYPAPSPEGEAAAEPPGTG
ncbi:MAG: exodeoxyribonuclease VII large subunit [Acidobacteriota bacterium]